MLNRRSQLSLALVVTLVVSTVVGAGVLAGAAAATSGVTTDRTVSSTSVSAGETVTVTTSVTVPNATDRMSITERFEQNFSAVSVTDVSFQNGSGVTVFKSAAKDGLDVALMSVTGGTTVQVTYEVTVPESASAGDSFNISGTANTPNATVDIGTTALDVVSVESTRTLGTTELTPNGTATVTVNVTAFTDLSRVSIAERLDGPVRSSSIESVEVDGTGSVLSRMSDTAGVDVALENVSAGTTIQVTYTVTVTENATNGQNVSISGQVAFDNASVTTGESSLSVVVNSKQVIAGDDDKVDSNELRSAIHSWATQKPVAGNDTVTTTDLRDLIYAWVTGKSV